MLPSWRLSLKMAGEIARKMDRSEAIRMPEQGEELIMIATKPANGDSFYMQRFTSSVGKYISGMRRE